MSANALQDLSHRLGEGRTPLIFAGPPANVSGPAPCNREPSVRAKPKRTKEMYSNVENIVYTAA